MKKRILLVLSTALYITSTYAQWQKTNGPYAGGYVYDIITSGAKIYAATGDGVYLSPDSGITWMLIGLSGQQVMSIALNGTSLFAGTYGFGVHVTNNDGASWTPINTGLPGYVIAQALAVSGSKIYLGLAGSGVYVSNNNGASWSNIYSGMQSSNVKSIVVSGSTIVVGTFGDGVFLSTNAGSSWAAVNSGITSLSINIVAIYGTCLYAGTFNGGVFYSENNGASWSAINTGLTYTTVYALAVSSSVMYAGTYSGIFKSVNNGALWTPASTGLFNDDVTCITISGTDVYAGVRGGIFLSEDNGSNWEMKGVNDTYITPLLAYNSIMFAGTINAGIYCSQDLGESWHATNNGLANIEIYSLASDGAIIYTGTADGVYASQNNGQNWIATNTGIEGMLVNAIAINGSKIYAGTEENGMFVSSNGGSTWLYTSLPVTKINSIAINGANIFVGTLNGVYRSINNGTSWTLSNTGITSSHINVLAIDGTTVFAGTSSGGVFRSTDNGSTWTAINNGLTYPNINSLIIEGNNVFASTFGGVFVSSDYGNTWHLSNNGITFSFVVSLAIVEKYIFAGTYGEGVFKRSLMLSVNNELICTGASATITATQTLGSDTATNYIWSNGMTGSTITVSPLSTTIYTVTATNGSLIDTAQSLVIVNQLPVVSVADNQVCNGESVTLHAFGANSYLWNTGDTLADIDVNPSATTTYSVIGISPGIGCRDTAEATVTVYPIPETPIIIRMGDTLISDAPYGNQWYYNNYTLWGSNGTDFICSLNGNYFVIVVLNGCPSDTSNIISVIDISVNEISNDFIFYVYPNPADDKINIEIEKAASFEMINMHGQLVYSKSLTVKSNNLDISNLPDGVYTLRIKTDRGIAIRKLIKQ